MLDADASSMLNTVSPTVRAMSTWGERIAEVLEETGLTQSGLAKLCGVSRSAVNQWVGGTSNPKPEHVFSVADNTRYSARWLGTGRGQKKDGKEPMKGEALALWDKYNAAPPDTRQAIDLLLRKPDSGRKQQEM